MTEYQAASLLVFFVVVLFVFLLIREVLTWYWKINEIVALLKKTSETLEKTNAILSSTKEDHRKGVQFMVDEIRKSTTIAP